MKRFFAAAVALGLAAVPLAGCEESLSCTLVGCGPTLHISVAPLDGGELPDATYEITLELDGTAYSTTCRLEDPGVQCDPVAGPATFDVDAEDSSLTTHLSLAVTVDGDEGDGPESVHLGVVANDAMLVDATLKPIYEVTFPNGERCGPGCVSAVVEVTFERP